MPTLTIMPSGKTIEVAPGTSLLQAIRDAGETLGSKCDGKAQCGACHLFVQEGRKSINRLTPAENAKLDTIPGVGSKSRLACQIQLGSDDVKVELLGFASGF